MAKKNAKKVTTDAAPADEVGGEGKDPADLVMLDTTAATLTKCVGDAAKEAQANANHPNHGALENFLVKITEFKAAIAAVEDEVDGEAVALLSRIKAIL